MRRGLRATAEKPRRGRLRASAPRFLRQVGHARPGDDGGATVPRERGGGKAMGRHPIAKVAAARRLADIGRIAFLLAQGE